MTIKNKTSIGNYLHKTVFIMRGISGSGKSTFVKENLDFAKICSADDFFVRLGKEVGQEYLFKQELLAKAHNECLQKFCEHVENNESFIVVDNTNLRLRDLKTYHEIALSKGYTVRVVQIHKAKEKCVSDNVHELNEDLIKKQHQIFVQNIDKIKELENVKVFDIHN